MRRRIWLWLLPLSLLQALAAADNFIINEVWFEESADGYALRADIAAGDMTPLDKILQGGYEADFFFELYFVRRREWWIDQQVGDLLWRGKLRYDSLVDTYLLTTDRRERRFSSLQRSIDKIQTLRSTPSAEDDYVRLLKHPGIYLRARMRVVIKDLPEPAKVGLLVEDWQSEGDWFVFPVDIRG